MTIPALTIHGPAGGIDNLPGHLFRCGHLFAVSLDPTGSNIPNSGCYEGWQHVMEFPLGVREVIPVAMSPEPILRGIRAYGYYVWSEGVARPTATTQ